MWSDNETKNDFLNYSETADLVATILRNENIRPVSLGIFGGWGTGKSSLMKMVVDDLSNDNNHIILEFDAWLFQDYDDARASLLQKIGDEIYERAKDDEALRDKAASLLKRINKLRVLGLAAEGFALAAGVPTFGLFTRGLEGLRDIVTGKGDKEDLDAVKSAAEDGARRVKGLVRPEDDESPPKQIEQFRLELRDLLEKLNCTLFVFIDNLDRCLPENAIHTLEAVRLFLFMERTAFVVAADEDMIRLAVRQHYKADLERLVTDYLDKLVQIPVRVPPPGVGEIRAFLTLLLAEQPATDSTALGKAKLEALKQFLLSRLRISWKEPFPNIDEIIEGVNTEVKLTPNEEECVRQAALLAQFVSPILVESIRVNGNPRIVKRMLNTLRMRQILASKRQINLSEEALMKLVLFERCAGVKATADLMSMIGTSEDGFVPLLRKIETEAPDCQEEFPDSWSPMKDFIFEWAKLPPSLGDKDLRAAAYLSKETKPIVASGSGLSAEGERALAVLIKATKSSIRSTTDAVKKLLPEEVMVAMDQLIKRMSDEESWKSRPEGWAGAYAVAQQSEEAGKALATLVRSRNLNPHPLWLKAQLKDASWWSE